MGNHDPHEQGSWGSVLNAEHPLCVHPTDDKRMCPDCRKPRRRITHVGMAAGVALMSGCEFHCYQWKRETEQMRRHAAPSAREEEA